MAEVFDTGIRLHNTATRRVEPLVTAERGVLRMYVCGPTTYTWAHIGHARSYVVYDVLKRVLRARGVRPLHAQNFTDMEEAIARRAKEEGLSGFDLAEKYAQAYLADMRALRVLPADAYPRASRHVDRMVSIVETLVARGQAYLVDCKRVEGSGPTCDVYFDTAKAKTFGQLVGQSLEAISADRPLRGERRHAADFALWKAHDDWGVTFASPWGHGRPGWHVECVAMSSATLGASFDLHGGGLDLVFPHHESERTIAEAATGREYVRHWMHNGFVTIGRAKMSKSAGNYLTIREALARHPAEALRRWLLTAPYRQPVEYDAATVKRQAEKATKAAGLAALLAARAGRTHPVVPEAAREAIAAFEEVLADDLRVHEALAAADGLVDSLDPKSLTSGEASGALATLRKMGDQLGIFWSITRPEPSSA